MSSTSSGAENRSSWTRRLRRLALPGAILLFVAAQLVTCAHDNPPVTARLKAPPAVDGLLHRACFDCHSNETAWPWYSHVSPVSWLVYRDVAEGRRHLNFSSWPTSTERQKKIYGEIAEAVEEGEMPMAIYPPLHPEARLSAEEKQQLIDWAKASARSLEALDH